MLQIRNHVSLSLALGWKALTLTLVVWIFMSLG